MSSFNLNNPLLQGLLANPTIKSLIPPEMRQQMDFSIAMQKTPDQLVKDYQNPNTPEIAKPAISAAFTQKTGQPIQSFTGTGDGNTQLPTTGLSPQAKYQVDFGIAMKKTPDQLIKDFQNPNTPSSAKAAISDAFTAKTGQPIQAFTNNSGNNKPSIDIEIDIR